jgi:hypothetical protein
MQLADVHILLFWGGVQQPDLVRLVTDVLSRMPQWVRDELSSKDPLVRARAEETLAGSISAAIAASGQR